MLDPMSTWTSLAERFASALSAVSAEEDDGPELLPVRLSRAVTRVLPVDGAGLCVRTGNDRRAPLGASDEPSTRAERLQFTVGAGPCTQAMDSGQPVFVVDDDLRARWPAFHDLLVQETPFRGVVALPLRYDLAGLGAMDLYFTDPADVATLDVLSAMGAGDLVSQALSEAAVWSDWSAADGPPWLHGPAAERRALVWQAIGLTGLAHDVPAAEALDRLRAHAYASGRLVDDLAADVVSGRADPSSVCGPASG
jgi:hypothetical protein